MSMILIALMAASGAAAPVTLNNGTVELHLAVNEAGVPYIAKGVWNDADMDLFQEAAPNRPLAAWLPEKLARIEGATSPWQSVPHPKFRRAEATRTLRNGIRVTWVVDLAKKGLFFRMQVRMANAGTEAQPVAWFPIWSGTWQIPGSADRLRTWRALSYEMVTQDLAGGKAITLNSRLHSSDNRPLGHVPYWSVKGPDGQVFFALEWCGGWRARLNAQRPTDDCFDFQVRLPEAETQLVLAAGQEVAGPVMVVTPVRESLDREARADWMKERERLRRAIYGGPKPWFPFAYNHWYAAGFDVDAAFLEGQVAALGAWEFDLLVVDAGWYTAVGQWEPDPEKFPEGRFETLMSSAKEKGAKAGIWSCPQFVHAGDPDHLPPEVDQPGLYHDFIDGHLIDMAGTDFSRGLADHVALLRDRYHADWWKYDRDFFTADTRHGAMMNVLALQDALLGVRKAQPDLYIENCQSGGRMINEFTALLAQSQWIRDGGGTGIEHARSNLREALGALAFLPPWSVNRWVNNPDKLDPEDDELLRYYCRSAMAGTWGLAADLEKISARQREIILAEAANYRRINEIKADCRYQILPADEYASFAGAVFYDRRGRQAALLLLRWEMPGEVTGQIRLPGLDKGASYQAEVVDTQETTAYSGADAVESGIQFQFAKGQDSTIIVVRQTQ